MAYAKIGKTMKRLNSKCSWDKRIRKLLNCKNMSRSFMLLINISTHDCNDTAILNYKQLRPQWPLEALGGMGKVIPHGQ